MDPTILEQIARWDGEAVTACYVPETEVWIFVAFHDTTLGPAVGGCRMKVYERPGDGLRDAMRLAEGMTYKWASVEFAFGGGKSVLALSRGLTGAERAATLLRFARLLRSLRGAYLTGVDLGTSPEDMRLVAEEAPYVMGVYPEESRDPGPYTALGVLEGMKSALRHLEGNGDLAGKRVLIQGVGDVGEPLARQLAEEGAELFLADLDEQRATSLASELEGAVVPPDEVWDAPVDILAPCAIGAVLNSETIPRLRCRIVAGSANNQLATPEDADALHARGILYAPDYMINAGGAIAFGSMHQGILEDGELRARVRRVGALLDAAFREAAERGESPAQAARRRAERFLQAARSERTGGARRAG